MTTKPKAPPDLGTRSRKFWRDVAGKYELRPDELLMLEEACREVDLIDRLEAELSNGGALRTKGSMGQDVADPMVTELRQHRNVLRGLLATLKLPDEPGEAKPGRRGAFNSQTATDAARARWGGRR